MSTRQLRRKRRDRDELAIIAPLSDQQLSEDADAESSGDEQEQINSVPNAFDLLSVGDDNNDGNEEELSDEDNEKFQVVQVTPPTRPSKKGKGKQKQAKKPKEEAKGKDQDKDDDLALIEAFSTSVSIDNATKTTDTPAANKTFDLPQCLKVNKKHLNTAPPQSTQTQRLVLSSFTSAQTYPKMIDLQKHLTLTSINTITSSTTNKTNNTETFTFTITNEETYATVHSLAMSHGQQHLHHLLQDPTTAFHPSVLYLNVIMKLVGEVGQLPIEMLERLLYVYERVLMANTPKQSCTGGGGGVWLPYESADNRPFFVALFFRAYSMQRQGYFEGAVECCKFALSLSGFYRALLRTTKDAVNEEKQGSEEYDALGFWLVLDLFSLRSEATHGLVSDIVDCVGKESMYIQRYPNWMFSYALSLFFVKTTPKAGNNMCTDEQMAACDDALCNAIRAHFYIVPRILDRCGMQFTPAEKTMFENHAFAPSRLHAMVADLYVHQSWAFWKQDEVMSWFRRCISTVLNSSSDTTTTIATTTTQHQLMITTLQIQRHLALLELIDNLPIPSAFYNYTHTNSTLEYTYHAPPSSKTTSWNFATTNETSSFITPWGVEVSAAWDPYPPTRNLSYCSIAPHAGYYRTRLVLSDPSTSVTKLLNAYEARRRRSALGLSEFVKKLGIVEEKLPSVVRDILYSAEQSSTTGTTTAKSSSTAQAQSVFSSWTGVLSALVESILPGYRPFGQQIQDIAGDARVGGVLVNKHVLEFMCNDEWWLAKE